MSFELAEQVVRDGGSELVVQHLHEHSGWAALPPQLAARLLDGGLPLPLALELRPVLRRSGLSLPSEAACYVSWAGGTCAAGCVGLPAALARTLRLGEGTAVAVRPLPAAPAAQSVTVEPASEDDWEIVELNAGWLEEQLLNQAGVASPHQPLLVWIRSVGVALRVTSLVPANAPVVCLVRGTEVYVAPRLRVRASVGDGAAGDVLQQQRGGAAQQAWPQQGAAAQAEEDAAAAPLQAVLRVQQVSDAAAAQAAAAAAAAAAEAVGDGGQPPPQQQQREAALPPSVQRAFASAATLAQCGLRAGDWVRLSGRDCRSLVKFACLAASEAAAPGHVALTAAQCAWAGAPPRTPIRLQRLTPSQRQLIVEAAEAQHSGSGSGNGGVAGGELLDQGANGGGSQQQQQQDDAVQQDGVEDDATAAAAALASCGWLRQGAEQALQHLLPVLGFTPRSLLQSWGAPRPGGLLVCGPTGSGKSALLAAAATALGRHPECLTHTVTLSWREISAEGASQAQAQILPKVQEALAHMPALLILDDLDVLCPAEASGPEGAAAAADPALVAWLCELLDLLAQPSADWGRLRLPGAAASSSSAAGAARGAAPPAAAAGAAGPPLWPPLAVAATCREPGSLAAPLRAAGRLDHVVSLPAPTADSRAAILAAAAAARGASLAPAHAREVAEQADGFDAADLEVLLDRALHVAVRRRLAEGSNGSDGGGGGGADGPSTNLQLAAVQRGGGGGTPPPALALTRADIEAALEGFTPAAFWGTGSRHAVQAGVSGWADVGGMEEARQALHEALELPTKYARLVAQAPLRLRTGVLLYGPPGCGKTHIVAAAVAATGVRCITVSGPELLNKYIGASEAAVRDVFARAAAAAPSLLFFDEFDAIAPQRGHDNTGVTDRVVNQLLTELDGVEGLRGVCVVAATSRPDLIDAALLRPGRLDRLIYCGLPSPRERGAVLAALARGVPLGAGVDLAELGYAADHFSGADLGALLAEAQLAAVHEALEGCEPGGAAAAAAGAPAGDGSPAAAGKHPGGSGGSSGDRADGAAQQAPAAPRRAAAQAPHGAVVLQQRHLEAALETARPSVPEAERERLEAIYARFRADRRPGGAAAADKGKGKVTWA